MTSQGSERSIQTTKWLTDSMIEAYAIMRGPLPKETGGNRGPLYVGHDDELEISSHSSAELADIPDRAQMPPLNSSLHYTAEPMPSIGLEIELNKFDTHGFIAINGRLVDPDSENSIYQAWTKSSNKERPYIPAITSSRGPCILSTSEESRVYEDFVNDEDDDEGDPRDLRITPETFAHWAQGAIKIEPPPKPVLKSMVLSIQARRAGHEYGVKRLALAIHVPQYDASTGLLTLEEYALPLLAPLSVDMQHIPALLAFSYPKDDMKYKRKHYPQVNTYADDQPVPSGPEVFTLAGIREAWVDPNKSESATQQVLKLAGFINNIRREKDEYNQRAAHKEEENRVLKSNVHALGRELAEIRTQLNELKITSRRRHREQIGQTMDTLAFQRSDAWMDAQKWTGPNEDLRKKAAQLVKEKEIIAKKIVNYGKSSHAEFLFGSTLDKVVKTVKEQSEGEGEV